VLIDEVDDDVAIGRTRGDAPEIDGIVSIENPAGLQVGQFAEVDITGSDEHDLQAVIAPNSSRFRRFPGSPVGVAPVLFPGKNAEKLNKNPKV